ncbi:MAG: 3TM-type holin [Pseudomonadota bacterium]
MITAFLGPIIRTVGNILDQVVDDADLREKLRHEMNSQLLAHKGNELEAQLQVVLAEAKGESALQRNWRPILMLTIVAIIANNYLIAPYLAAMGLVSIQLELPERLWDLMALGVGGYVVGRSAEKSIKAYRSPGAQQFRWENDG